MIILKIDWGAALITTFLGITIVFIALVILVICFQLLAKMMTRQVKSKKVKLGKAVDHLSDDELHVPAADTAAIAMALHLYFSDVHDIESNVITIKRIERRYSPWSSKIYGINNLVR